MSIEFTSRPKKVEIDLLTQKIKQEIPQFGSANPFAFFLTDRESSYWMMKRYAVNLKSKWNKSQR